MMNDHVLTLLERILKMALTGERYASDGYNKQRYADIAEDAHALYKTIPGFHQTILQPLDQEGYITPKVGVNAIIENEKGELLLEKRSDDGCWGLLGGWAEVGFTPQENVLRELKEEAGIDARVVRLLDVISRKPQAQYPYTSYHLIFLCEVRGGNIRPSHESSAIEWRRPQDIQEWHFDHKEWLQCLGKL